jgi:hypothetical protein
MTLPIISPGHFSRLSEQNVTNSNLGDTNSLQYLTTVSKERVPDFSNQIIYCSCKEINTVIGSLYLLLVLQRFY